MDVLVRVKHLYERLFGKCIRHLFVPLDRVAILYWNEEVFEVEFIVCI